MGDRLVDKLLLIFLIEGLQKLNFSNKEFYHHMISQIKMVERFNFAWDHTYGSVFEQFAIRLQSISVIIYNFVSVGWLDVYVA